MSFEFDCPRYFVDLKWECEQTTYDHDSEDVDLTWWQARHTSHEATKTGVAGGWEEAELRTTICAQMMPEEDESPEKTTIPTTRKTSTASSIQLPKAPPSDEDAEAMMRRKLAEYKAAKSKTAANPTSSRQTVVSSAKRKSLSQKAPLTSSTGRSTRQLISEKSLTQIEENDASAANMTNSASTAEDSVSESNEPITKRQRINMASSTKVVTAKHPPAPLESNAAANPFAGVIKRGTRERAVPSTNASTLNKKDMKSSMPTSKINQGTAGERRLGTAASKAPNSKSTTNSKLVSNKGKMNNSATGKASSSSSSSSTAVATATATGKSTGKATASTAAAGAPNSKRQEKTKAAEDDVDDMMALLKKHNQRFASAPVYEPPRHSVRDVRKWEKQTGKTWAKLNPEEREAANSDISRMKEF